MVDKKISELTALGATPDAADQFVLVDTDADETKKVLFSNLIAFTASSTDTLTNKTVDLTDNTVTGTLAEFNTAISDASITTAASTDTFTNKTIDANGTGNSVTNIQVADLANDTSGQLITWSAAGAPASVTAGTSGQILTSQGGSLAPLFAAAAGGSNFEVKTGSFTGDGNATKALTGVGFQPDFVILNIMTIAGVGQFHKSSDDGTKTNSFSAPAVIGEYSDDLIISLDADGFTIGDGTGSTVGNAINTSSRVSRWEAFKWS